MDRKLKHLEFIQAVINRLSTNSFLLKGWSVVLVAALVTLSARDANVAFAYLAYIPAIVFWGLDGYFLAVERAYRRHYERVRGREPDEIDFCMNTGDLGPRFGCWIDAVMSKTLVPFHGALIAAVLVVMITQM